MNRMAQRQSEMVAAAIDYIPSRLRPLVECDVFCGDPIFAGLHDTSDTTDGRSYRDTAHVCYPHHVADGRTTLVLPDANDTSVYVGLHELGHVLHWTLQERAGGWDTVPELEPVTDYGATSPEEAFAEAFCAWFYEPQRVDSSPLWRGWSRPNVEWFDRLAAGW